MISHRRKKKQDNSVKRDRDMENIMEKTVKRTTQWLIKMAVILALCVVLLVGVSLLYTDASANAAVMADQTITVSNVTVNRGAEFDVDYSISNNSQGIQAIRLFVTYDPTAMTLLEVTPSNPVSSEDWTSEFEAAGKDDDGTYGSYGVKRFVLMWINTSSKWYGEGKIATLRFVAKSSAAVKDYQITTVVDTDSTLLSLGEKRDLHISGGTITVIPGKYGTFLYDAYGEMYAYEEDNNVIVTIEDALAQRGGLLPDKESTTKYTYTFRAWREVDPVDGHAAYVPTYTATPVKYDITFKKGIVPDGESDILYTGENTSDSTVKLPYAGIINYDAEIPARFDEHYSFHGWYKDEACTQPVDFVVMPDRDVTVYGYFGVNVDDPSVTTTTLGVDTTFVREGGVDYLYATVNVNANYGVNSLLFAPVFDDAKLEFVGFLYESDSPFYHSFETVFPEINDAVKTGGDVVDAWQLLDEDEDLTGKKYLFINVNSNVFTTGKLITFKFKVKSAGESAVDLAIGNRDVTRFDAAGGIYYANAIVEEGAVKVVRVVKPTAFTAEEKSYTYDPTGNKVPYEFKTKGGEAYYDLAGNEHDEVGEYTATATLKEIADTLVTWEDGTVDALDFDYEILPFVVDRPEETDAEYVYTGNVQYFALTQNLAHVDYYTITGNEQTAAGSYPVTVALKDSDNFIWDNETTGPLAFTFTIKRLKVVKPTAYTALEKSYTFDPGNMAPAAYDNNGVLITYEFKAEDNASKAYYSVSDNKKSAVGAYTVTVALSDTDNTEWKDDDQTVDTADLLFPFVINKYLIDTPTVPSKAYNGELQTATVTMPTNAPFTITANEGGIALGDYDVVFTIGDEYFVNYGWKSSEGKSVTAVFHIAESANEWTIQPYVYGKTYDGTAATVGASVKYGTVEILYRLQSGTDEDYTSVAPVNAGAYLAKFFVEGTASYDPLVEVVPFVISKVRLNKPVAYTAEEKTYTYTGSPISYVFKQEGNAEVYSVSGNVYTDAGNYTVTVAIKNENKANYVWKGATEAEDNAEDLSYPFVISKAQIPIPVAADRSYIYNGEVQTFEFTTVEYYDRYSIYGAKHSAPGVYVVTARIETQNKGNYEWEDGTTDDKAYEFAIRYASLTAATTTGEYDFAVTVASNAGFDANSAFVLSKASSNAASVLADIASANKTGALGQLTDEAATSLVSNKCFVGSLVLNLSPAAPAGEYATTIDLPVTRANVVVLRFVGDTVEVFAVQQAGKKVTFTADSVGNYVILADHDFVYEVADPAYLVSPATCDEAAVYYKSCSCGATNGTDTFAYGEPLGHNYDFDNIVWTWSADHLSATAKVTCLRDGAHLLTFAGEDVTVTVVSNVPPAVDKNGRIERKASFIYDGVTYYSDVDVEIVAAGHVYNQPPVWSDPVPHNGTYSVKATFFCDCGESVVTKDATVTMEETATELIYTAEVVFQGVKYTKEFKVDHPLVVFIYVEDADEVSVLLLPGDSVPFASETGHERDGYIFVGWRDEAGALIVAEGGVYPERKIGVERLHFTAVWKKLTSVSVDVTDPDGTPIQGATVALYENDDPLYDVGAGGVSILIPNYTAQTSATGEVIFPSIPCGNYRLVVSHPYVDGVDIVRSTYLDVTEDSDEGVRVTVVLPKTKFNTVVDGIGSAEGLDDAISEEEKNAITDGTGKGTINEIVITQKRSVTDVTDEIKEQIIGEVEDTQYARGELVDFYDVTLWKTTTIRNEDGEQYIINEQLSSSFGYQTNIFPITAAMRAQILAFNGSVDNIFVFKRHEYAGGVIVIYNLPKYDEKEGEKAETECFFIKRVAGQEYIAIRQKEYSVFAFGVSPDPILIVNKITSLTISDRTYGDTTPFDPVAKALYFENSVIYTYATERDGDYSATKPVNAGTYYLKAFIEARDGYAAAEAIVSFKIAPKVVTRPTADTTKFIYNGQEQTYTIASSTEYVVTGNKKTDAGQYVVKVALADPDNTVWDSGLTGDLTFDFVIEKKKLTDIGAITFEDGEFWFNGKKHSIFISGDLPEGIEVKYIGNEESDLGKFVVTAVFVSTNPNYDVSEPMTAVMHIRLNWVPILILIIIALLLLIATLVIVEKMLKKEKQGQTPPDGGSGGGGTPPTQGAGNTAEEGSNND